MWPASTVLLSMRMKFCCRVEMGAFMGTEVLTAKAPAVAHVTLLSLQATPHACGQAAAGGISRSSRGFLWNACDLLMDGWASRGGGRSRTEPKTDMSIVVAGAVTSVSSRMAAVSVAGPALAGTGNLRTCGANATTTSTGVSSECVCLEARAVPPNLAVLS